jgi:hypothetical protein
VKEEDIDWRVYHLILQQKVCSNEWLASSCGYETDILKASLSRLERYLLIEGTSDGWRTCQLNEIILKKQVNDSLCDGIELSGGVIRYRPPARENKE